LLLLWVHTCCCRCLVAYREALAVVMGQRHELLLLLLLGSIFWLC
jgi:hypothetical protein